MMSKMVRNSLGLIAAASIAAMMATDEARQPRSTRFKKHKSQKRLDSAKVREKKQFRLKGVRP